MVSRKMRQILLRSATLSKSGCAAINALTRQLRPVLASIVAFCLYNGALPNLVFVYWVMFMIAVSGAMLLFRFILLVEQFVAPNEES